MPVTVRDLVWGDMPSLVENYLALYDEVKENPDLGMGLYPMAPSLGEEAAWFAGLFRRIQEGTTIAGVADAESKAVALCTVDRRSPLREGQHVGVLGLLVARPYRDRGIGKSLLRYTLDRCRGKYEQVELSVFVTNTRARSLYRSLGFQPWGIDPKAIQRGGRYTDLEHMVLDLR